MQRGLRVQALSGNIKQQPTKQNPSIQREVAKYRATVPPGTDDADIHRILTQSKGDKAKIQDAISALWEDHRGQEVDEWATVSTKKTKKNEPRNKSNNRSTDDARRGERSARGGRGGRGGRGDRPAPGRDGRERSNRDGPRDAIRKPQPKGEKRDAKRGQQVDKTQTKSNQQPSPKVETEKQVAEPEEPQTQTPAAPASIATPPTMTGTWAQKIKEAVAPPKPKPAPVPAQTKKEKPASPMKKPVKKPVEKEVEAAPVTVTEPTWVGVEKKSPNVVASQSPNVAGAGWAESSSSVTKSPAQKADNAWKHGSPLVQSSPVAQKTVIEPVVTKTPEPAMTKKSPRQVAVKSPGPAFDNSGAVSPKQYLKLGKWDSAANDSVSLQFGSFSLNGDADASPAATPAAAPTENSSNWGVRSTNVGSGWNSSKDSNAANAQVPEKTMINENVSAGSKTPQNITPSSGSNASAFSPPPGLADVKGNKASLAAQQPLQQAPAAQNQQTTPQNQQPEQQRYNNRGGNRSRNNSGRGNKSSNSNTANDLNASYGYPQQQGALPPPPYHPYGGAMDFGSNPAPGTTGPQQTTNTETSTSSESTPASSTNPSGPQMYPQQYGGVPPPPPPGMAPYNPYNYGNYYQQNAYGYPYQQPQYGYNPRQQFPPRGNGPQMYGAEGFSNPNMAPYPDQHGAPQGYGAPQGFGELGGYLQQQQQPNRPTTANSGDNAANAGTSGNSNPQPSKPATQSSGSSGLNSQQQPQQYGWGNYGQPPMTQPGGWNQMAPQQQPSGNSGNASSVGHRRNNANSNNTTAGSAWRS